MGTGGGRTRLKGGPADDAGRDDDKEPRAEHARRLSDRVQDVDATIVREEKNGRVFGLALLSPILLCAAREMFVVRKSLILQSRGES